MRVTMAMACLVLMAGCDRGTPTGPGTATQPSDRLREDLRQTGQDLKAAAQQAADQAKPALRQLKEESREAVHDLAARVADKTAGTQPGTMPQ